MKRHFAVAAIALACAVSAGLEIDAASNLRAGARAQESDELDFQLAQDEKENDSPLVLSVDDDNPQPAEEKLEELPSTVVQRVDENNDVSPDSTAPSETLDEEEMKALSRQPLFREFANIIDETAPLPEDVDLGSLDVPGAQLVLPMTPGREEFGATPQTAPGEIEPALERLLNETLAIADVDLDQYELAPAQKRALEALDAEIGRIWPLWIDAEINRNVVGRRERDWRQNDYTRFSTAPGKTIEAPGADLALALDEPFWFQVVDLLSGESFFTKAGDFEQLDATGTIALLREERRYSLVIEEGRVAPTGRAMRVKILKDGTIQGVDASGRLVTDVNLGQIPLFMFQNPARMESQDGVFFTPTPFSGPPQRAGLNIGTKIGVNQHSLTLSNGKPEELLARVGVLCKSKARLFELVAHASIPSKNPTEAVATNSYRGIDSAIEPVTAPETNAVISPETTEDAKTIPAPELVATPDPDSNDEEPVFVLPGE